MSDDHKAGLQPLGTQMRQHNFSVTRLGDEVFVLTHKKLKI